MKTQKQWWTSLALAASLAVLLQFSTNSRAQDQNQPAPPDQGQYADQGQGPDDQSQGSDDQDPPGRVARLDFSQGAVSFQPAGEGDWVTAVPNRPLVTDDNLWTDENSRAEVHIGSTALRLGAKTGITLLQVDDTSTQIRLAQGSLIVRVRHVDDDDSYEIDTPNIAFTVLQPGEYRIDVSEDGSQTITTVWHGRGRAVGGGLSYTVLANQAATFTGTDHLDYDLGQIPNQDGLDEWAFDRDAREDRSDTANYVSREMTGYEDLDDNGDWSYQAGYGECWRPRTVAVGWAPYRFGHWAWVGRWGWTWVEDEPWGFAPFHYGRWASVNNGWFWVPGPVVVRPVWAPALVAFVGGGPGFRFSAGVGVGWFPLGPGEVFVPGYRVSRSYVNNVNITNTNVNITRVTNVYNTVVINKTVNNFTYVNQRVNGGVTVVSHDAFVNARPVAQNIMRVEPRELATAPVSHRFEAEPVRQSVVGAGRPVSVRPPAAIINRPVVAQRTPPPPPRSFDQRQVQAGGHLNQQPLVRQEPPARPYQPTEAGRPQPVQTQQGFHSFGQPNNSQPNNSRSDNGRPDNGRPEDNNNHVRQLPQQPPHTFEQQGSAEPERNPSAQDNAHSNMQRPQNFRPPQQQNEARPPQESHPLVRPTPPVQERSPQQEQEQAQKFHTWEQQRPAPTVQRQPQPQSRPEPRSEPKQEESSKPKGH